MTDKTEQNNPLGVLGGTGLLESDFMENLPEEVVETEEGDVRVHTGDHFHMIQRHNSKNGYTPPHEINHRAHILALKQLGVQKIFAVQSVGSLTNDIPPGRLVIPSDYINPWQQHTYYDDERGHRVAQFDRNLQVRIREVLKNENMKLSEEAIYIQTKGPRFESPAEANLFSDYGDVVGMTAVSELVLATEQDLPYATLCCADNYVNGIQGTEITMKKFKEQVKKHQPTVVRAAEAVIEALTR